MEYGHTGAVQSTEGARDLDPRAPDRGGRSATILDGAPSAPRAYELARSELRGGREARRTPPRAEHR